MRSIMKPIAQRAASSYPALCSLFPVLPIRSKLLPDVESAARRKSKLRTPATKSGAARPSAKAAPPHVPVLMAETLAFLHPRAPRTYVDGTLGAGGHSRFISKTIRDHGPGGRLFAFDRDPMALEVSRPIVEEYSDIITPIKGKFGRMFEILTEKHACAQPLHLVAQSGLSADCLSSYVA